MIVTKCQYLTILLLPDTLCPWNHILVLSQHAYHSPVASRPVPMASVQADNIVDLVEKVDAVNA